MSLISSRHNLQLARRRLHLSSGRRQRSMNLAPPSAPNSPTLSHCTPQHRRPSFAEDVAARLDAHERALAGAAAETQRLDSVATRMRARRAALERDAAAFRDAAPAEQAALHDSCREAERDVKVRLFFISFVCSIE